MKSAPPASHLTCIVCGYATDPPDAAHSGTVRGNTARFLNTQFHLWKCPRCESIHALDPVDFADIYRDYPPNSRPMDGFAKLTLGNLLRRCKKAGLKKNSLILDYGCGNGIFLELLRKHGYERLVGFDPYVSEFSKLDETERFDFIVANDVIEHVPDPRALFRTLAGLLAPGGVLYVGTADSSDVDLRAPEAYLLKLHQPFHRVIVNQEWLIKLGSETPGLTLMRSYRRSYMDTFVPFANYRFLDELSRALGYNMDRMFTNEAPIAVLKHPRLWFFGFFGRFFPSAYEPAVVLRKA